MPSTLPDRLRAQLALALLGDCGCAETLARLEETARRQGLTGAEIDAALAGRSFEARAAALVGYACALRDGRAELAEAARRRALACGIAESELRDAADLAREARASSGGDIAAPRAP